MTVLSDLEIMGQHRAGNIVIEPFDQRNLGGASYDVRLGEFYYKAEGMRREGDLITYPRDYFYNIYSPENVLKVWGSPKRARVIMGDVLGPYDDRANIADDDFVIMLPPHGNLLCHTQEFIGARRGATSKMQARSSIGRSMINVCSCAGQGDPGYVNRWTMEIYNRGDFYIPLVVGRRVAQISFSSVGPTARQYGNKDKYQETADLDELMRAWTPEMMLPRLDRDWELTR